MSGGGAAEAAERIGSGLHRAVRAFRVMGPERRLAACAAIGLVLTLFLPWYQETLFAPGSKKLESASASITGWGAFSFVEAALLLVAAGVLTLLFQRAEGRGFHLPGGDGWVVMAAGIWACALIVWRIFDKQGGSAHGQIGTTYGIEWGIFVALAVAALLTYSGSRIRAAHQTEPPLPGEAEPPRARSSAAGARPDRRPRSDRQQRPDRQPSQVAAQRPASRRPPSRQPRSADRSEPPEPSDEPAFPAPPAWSGGDVPTFDTQRLGGDPRQHAEPPAPPEAVTRVHDPDPHSQPTTRIKRPRSNGDI